MERELKRGTLEMLLLRLLTRREMYGYEIVTALHERSGGRLEITDGTLYPVLYRLERDGHVEARWQTPERGVPRKYYRVTERGATELATLVDEWRSFVEAVAGLLDTGQDDDD
jgi:PadR family transcriptional regulator PadR